MNIEQLSAWMDGELDCNLEQKILANWCVDDSSVDVWNTYHMIGEVLREPNTPVVDISVQVMKAIELEDVESLPSVVDTVSSEYGSWQFWGIAASLLISLMGVGLLLSHPNPETKHLMMAQEENSVQHVLYADANASQSSAYYEFLHHEVSPMSGFQTVDYPIPQ